jgi:hypothetical protein
LMKNAITMAGQIDRCWLFTYRVPSAEVERLLPPPLELVTRGPWAFINIVVSHLRQMRPKGLPAAVGIGYWHVAYRLYAKARSVEGLYFLRSDADSPLMVAAGNLLTDFKFHLAAISVEDKRILVRSPGADVDVLLGGDAKLPADSAFGSLEEADQFLKYKPAGLTVASGKAHALKIDRVEDAWRSRLVGAESARFDFLDSFDAHPEIIYEVEPIDYIWNRGRRV